MVDFNAKVGEEKGDKITGPYGLADRNANGEKLIELCKEKELMIADTWFEQRTKNRHTWVSPGEDVKNQIGFILISQRYRNSVKNTKTRPSADCGSDHLLLKATIKLKLKNIKRSKRKPQWNTEILKSATEKEKFQTTLKNRLQEEERTKETD